MTLITALGREGYGYADTKEYDPKTTQPEMKAPGIYSPSRRETFRSVVKKIANLERMLRGGRCSEEDKEHLESLKDMVSDEPYGC
ncbi:MAG TPA: hypothetical protein VJH92_03495 [Candidatus Nanoarchaeia archaeon]|nr:hypothetical protein [Candidatus Nanoarchaeia archaeon]